jgi:hypothetical protein
VEQLERQTDVGDALGLIDEQHVVSANQAGQSSALGAGEIAAIRGVVTRQGEHLLGRIGGARAVQGLRAAEKREKEDAVRAAVRAALAGR